MIVVIAIIFCFLLIKDLSELDKKYLKKLQYSIPFVLGILMLLIFWSSVIYYEYFSSSKMAYIIILLFPFGFTLFFKGAYELCVLRKEYNNKYKICKNAYKSMIVLDLFIVIASILYFFTH